MAQGDYLIPGASAVTELGSRVGGVIAGCGEAAYLVIKGIASGQPPTVQDVTATILKGAAKGYTGPTGVSTPSGLKKLAASEGINLQIGAGGGNAIATIEANLARGLPTEVGVANASALGGSDVGVKGHYVTVVGKTAGGAYITADPNQPQSRTGGFVNYSAQQLLGASPFATLTPTNITPQAGIGSGVVGALGGDVVQSFFAAFGTSAPDFAWRAGLIVGGMVLIVAGMLIFFSHEEGTVVETVTNAVTKAAGTAAAS